MDRLYLRRCSCGTGFVKGDVFKSLMATLNNCSHSSLPTSISMKNSSVLQVKDRKLETLGKGIPGTLQLRELEIEGPLSNVDREAKHL